MAIGFVDIDGCGRAVRIEHEWIAPQRASRPLLIFLHEGLGSRSLWKEFPRELCDAAGCRGLVYSRPGYGRSTPRAPHERWDVDYMHRQAHELLPALLGALGVKERPWLVGHSDGASIALLYAAAHPDALAGLVLMAPHVFVEDVALSSIAGTRDAFADTDMAQRLARHHDDVDSAFWGWNRIWLQPAFARWNITDELAEIRCPVLAIQGLDDAYGTLAQIRGIAERVPRTQLLELPHCGHSPHRDQPEQVITATQNFIHHRRQAT